MRIEDMVSENRGIVLMNYMPMDKNLKDLKKKYLEKLDEELGNNLTHRKYENLMIGIEDLMRVMYEQGRRDRDDIGKDAARRE